ncbi:hypothetical protein EJB05_56769 [Eragrostis curvula]|uniref:Uncharacterized protein n=1 Tax=Eragrostis curvula TaxID=38414 RepID=A0A5J9SGI9_9POAL|nr:hypothetical protein EJB05_56769 [Eragrostis curvula]
MLEKPLYQVISGKESSADLVVELTGMSVEMKDLCKTVRRHLELQSSVDKQGWTVTHSHMYWLMCSLVKGAAFGFTLVLGALVIQVMSRLCRKSK